MSVQKATDDGKQAKTSGKVVPAVVNRGFVNAQIQQDFGYLVDENGIFWPISKYMTETLTDNIAPDGLKSKGDLTLPYWTIDKGGASYTKSRKNPNSCVYDATKKYIEAMSLGTFTMGDKEFFSDHPGVTTDGVDRANVLGVAHGLLIPWGLGISRIWVPKLSAIGDQEREFMEALGCNPMAILDADTSNDEFIQRMGLDPGGESAMLVRELNLFEFVDSPPGPAVVMLSYSGTGVPKTNVSGKWSGTGYGGMGHAEFIGPRDRIHATWHIAFSINRLERIHYKDGHNLNRYSTLDTFAEQIAAQEKAYKELNPWQCKIRGVTITSMNRKQATAPVATHSYRSASYQQVKPVNGGTVYQPMVAPAKPTMREEELGRCPDCGGLINDISGIKYCLMCNWYEDDEEGKTEESCPFCGDSTVIGRCNTCDYDDLEWIQSSHYECRIHRVPMLFYSPHGTASMIWACQLCNEEEPTLCGDFINETVSHEDRKLLIKHDKDAGVLEGGL